MPKKYILSLIVFLVLVILGGVFFLNRINNKPAPDSIKSESLATPEDNQKTFSKPIEVSLSEELEKTMISQMVKKLGYEIKCEYCYFENKLFKGSFKEPFSEEYLLMLNYSGPMASSGIFVGLFNKDNSLITAYSFGGGSHSFTDFGIYDCNKKGLSLVFADYKGCSNGSPFCSANASLYSFNNETFYPAQQIINQEKVEIEVQGNEISIYKWKTVDYPDETSYKAAETTINEKNCKKVGCKNYWQYPPYTRAYLLFDQKLVYNEDSCMFEADKELVSTFNNVVIENKDTKKEEGKMTDEEIKKLLGGERVIWNDSPRCVDIIYSDYGAIGEKECIFYSLANRKSYEESCIKSSYKTISFKGNQIRKCQAYTVEDVFSNDYFLDKDIAFTNLINMSSYYKEHNVINNGLSPEQVAFLIVSNKIYSLSSLSKENLRYYYTKRLFDSEEDFMRWQDTPTKVTVRVMKTEISGNTATVKVFPGEWDSFSLVLKFDGNNWGVDSELR
ncbi:MAG: hypothetical protein WC472_02100 [Candidatus Paceibacterota bacterium]